MRGNLTPEQEALATAWIEQYNTLTVGKRLRDLIPDELMLAIVRGMMAGIVRREGHEELWEVVGPLMAEAVSVGIWVAEVGKTKLCEGKGEIQ